MATPTARAVRRNPNFVFSVLIISFSIGVWLGLAVRIKEEIGLTSVFFIFFKIFLNALASPSVAFCSSAGRKSFRLVRPNEQFQRQQTRIFAALEQRGLPFRNSVRAMPGLRKTPLIRVSDNPGTLSNLFAVRVYISLGC